MIELKQDTVYWSCYRVRLTAYEIAVFRKLWENRGKSVTVIDLAVAVWGDTDGPADETYAMYNLITRLRKKLKYLPLAIFNYAAQYVLLVQD